MKTEIRAMVLVAFCAAVSTAVYFLTGESWVEVYEVVFHSVWLLLKLFIARRQ